MMLTPYISSNDIFRLLKQQKAKRILYINESGKKNDELFIFMSNKLGRSIKVDTTSFSHNDSTKLTYGLHVILIRGEILSKNQNINEILKN